MDIYKKLKSDHRSIQSIVNVLVNTTNKQIQKRQELLHELYLELEAHNKAEEKTFYNELRRFEEDYDLQDQLNRSVEEHVEIDNILLKLKSLPVATDKWLVTARELKKCIDHHILEEEGALFTIAREHFKPSSESILGNKLEIEEAQTIKTLSL